MIEKTLEFRGISLGQLMDYLLECGAKPCSDRLPYLFAGEQWQAEILREEEVQITSRFQVNAVFIRFQANTQEMLDFVIASYRKKTLRVGG